MELRCFAAVSSSACSRSASRPQTAEQSCWCALMKTAGIVRTSCRGRERERGRSAFAVVERRLLRVAQGHRSSTPSTLNTLPGVTQSSARTAGLIPRTAVPSWCQRQKARAVAEAMAPFCLALSPLFEASAWVSRLPVGRIAALVRMPGDVADRAKRHKPQRARTAFISPLNFS